MLLVKYTHTQNDFIPRSTAIHPPAPTLDEVIETGARLHPKRAIGRQNLTSVDACSTPVITRITLGDGTIKDLALVGERYGAVYCRVSTDEQAGGRKKRNRDDSTRMLRIQEKQERVRRGEIEEAEGLSVRDQISRNVKHFIEKGQAFRIFSDISLGGGLPPMIPNLITSMWVTKAKSYRKAYNTVFNLDKKWTIETAPDELAKQRIAYRDQQYEMYKRGGYKTDAHGITGTVEKLPKKVRERSKPYYRPALTALIDSLTHIHTVAVTDISRLSRAHELTVEMMKRFGEHSTEIVGTIESAAMYNDAEEDFGADLSSTIMSKNAERKLTEQAMGAMRGFLRKLEDGKAATVLPWWLRKGADGKPERIDERVEIVVDAAHRYLAGETLYQIADRLNKQGIPSPFGTKWQYQIWRKWLGERAIIGRLSFYGTEWDIYPHLIPDALWERIQPRLRERGETYARRVEKKHPTRLLIGLLRCSSCGKSMHHKYSGSKRGQAMYGCATGHPTLPADTLDGFFSDLMEGYSAELLDTMQAGLRGQALREEIEALRARQEEVACEIAARRETARAEQVLRAKEFLRKDTIDEQAEYIRLMIEVGIREALGLLYEEEKAITETLKERQEQYDLLLPSSAIDALREQSGRWSDLDPEEKNQVMKQVFESVVHVRQEDGTEYLQPWLRAGGNNCLSPIPITVTDGPPNQHGPTYRRALPETWKWSARARSEISRDARREHFLNLPYVSIYALYKFSPKWYKMMRDYCGSEEYEADERVREDRERWHEEWERKVREDDFTRLERAMMDRMRKVYAEVEGIEDDEEFPPDWMFFSVTRPRSPSQERNTPEPS